MNKLRGVPVCTMKGEIIVDCGGSRFLYIPKRDFNEATRQLARTRDGVPIYVALSDRPFTTEMFVDGSDQEEIGNGSSEEGGSHDAA